MTYSRKRHIKRKNRRMQKIKKQENIIAEELDIIVQRIYHL